jgi:hypothetical protein
MAMAAVRSRAGRARAWPAAGFILGLALAGCSGDRAPFEPAPSGSAIKARAGAAILAPGPAGAGALLAQIGRKPGHPYFPIVPGAFSDYRVTRLGVGIRYVRVTAGNPETFFGRQATPFVYGDVPGQTRDSTLFGLRQFWSISPDGDLWFHGAQNNGFMSHTTPPVRMLRAKVKPGDAWIDSVYFESFLPGGVPFFQNNESYAWTVSDDAWLALPGGVFKALRSSAVLDDLPAPAVRAGAFPAPGGAGGQAFAARGLAPLPEPLRGTWFSRHDGMVARDWPSGQGEVNLNSVTFELVGQGTGPVPPPTPPPIDPGTQ